MFKSLCLQIGLITVGIALSTATALADPPVTDPIPAVAAADKSLSQGVIVYSRQTTMSQKNQQSEGKIVYLPDSRFESNLDFRDQNARSVTYWDGKQEISQVKSTTPSAHTNAVECVALNVRRPMELMPEGYLIMVRPGPSFVLGRGLSLLKNLRVVSTTADSVTVTGNYVDKNSVATAILDPRNDFVAKRITIDFGDKHGNTVASATWTLGPPMKSASGQMIASAATYEVPSINQVDHYVIRRADFRRPALSIPKSVPAGQYVADMRAGPKNFFRLSRSQTLDQIMDSSRKQAATRAALDAQTKSMEEAYNKRHPVSPALPILPTILAVTLGALLVILWRLRRH